MQFPASQTNLRLEIRARLVNTFWLCMMPYFLSHVNLNFYTNKERNLFIIFYFLSTKSKWCARRGFKNWSAQRRTPNYLFTHVLSPHLTPDDNTSWRKMLHCSVQHPIKIKIRVTRRLRVALLIIRDVYGYSIIMVACKTPLLISRWLSSNFRNSNNHTLLSLISCYAGRTCDNSAWLRREESKHLK